MKKCNLCQATQDDDNKFCSQCGGNEFTPIDEEFTNEIHHSKVDRFLVSNYLSKKKIIILVAIIVFLIILIVFLSSFFSPANQIIRNIKNNKFSNAVSIYQEQVATDSNNYQKTYDAVSDYLEDIINQYRKQDVSYDYVISKLNGIRQLGILERELSSAYTEVNMIYFCRETYSAAENAYNDENYVDAIPLYAKIAHANFENGEDAAKKYIKSVDRYRENILSTAQKHIDSEEYTSALDVLEEALLIIPEDAELLSLQQTCVDTVYNNDIQNMLNEAKLYMSKNDYASALNLLDTYISNYPDELLFQQEKNACLTAFETYVENESLRLANANDFQHALSLAESGLNYFSSSRISELITLYKTHIPVILGEMEIFQNDTDGGSWGSKTDKKDKYLTDNYGNTYSNSFSADCGSITYLVNFKYQTFTGTVAFPKGLESTSTRESATLVIYGDDNKIAEFTNFNEASKPVPFSLDISKYEKITLKWKCTGSNIWSNWGYFATIFDGALYPIPLDIPDAS